MTLIVNILFIAVILMLIISFASGRSSIWGGATWGVIIGAIIGLLAGDIFMGGKIGLTIGGIIGIASELLGKWSDKLKK